MTTVPKLWPGSTIVCLGTGPSLTPMDVEAVRGLRVIAINDAIDVAPQADALYSSDQQWWRTRRGAPTFDGLKYTIAPRKHLGSPFHYPDVQVIDNTGPLGLELDPTALRHGRNSGYAAINLAVHLGAARILLLGYNMGPVARRLHFNDAPANGASYDKFARAFDSIVQPLKQLGVEVINCTSPTRLQCFSQASLQDALALSQAAA